MKIAKKLILVVLVLAMAFSSIAAASVPKKIEVQLPAKAGGGTDVAGRQLTDWISKNGGTTMTIKNNTDGGGVVAYETIRAGRWQGQWRDRSGRLHCSGQGEER